LDVKIWFFAAASSARGGFARRLAPFALAGAVGCTPAPHRAPAEPAPTAPASAIAPSPRADAATDAAADAAADAGQPASTGPRRIDPRALAKLVADARTRDSDELVIEQHGRRVGDWRFTSARTPIETMSITKSVLSLAVGSLIDRGKLRLDEPVHHFFPVWDHGTKRDVTLYHLLSHSSGIDEGESAGDIYAHKSFVQFVLGSRLAYPPGTHYRYSNRAPNLVSAIIARAAGMPTDRYVQKTLFAPLGIHRFWWTHDRAGEVEGLAGLHLLPDDLAKIGELVLGRGSYQGRRVVSEAWIERSTATLAKVQPTNRRLGLLWWLVPAWTRVTIDADVVDGWRRAGASAAFVDQVKPLVGRTFHSVPAFVAALRALFGDPKLEEWSDNTWKRGVPDARFEYGPVVGTYAEGTLGQFLVVLPRDELVAVRMRRMPKTRDEREDEDKAFPDFVERIQGLLAPADHVP
jgi:CubicO group peptidase (beta-lactamase class C family)